MNSRVRGNENPSSSTGPESQPGAGTSTPAVPNTSRASCCSTSETPQVTSRVSSGRWYIRRSSVASRTTPSTPPTANAIGSDTTSDSPAEPSTFCVTYAVYAPAMMNSPCAMLITPIWPNVRARPSAASSRIEPPDRPLKTCVTRTSTSAREAGGPRVRLQVRVRLDRRVRGPLGVDEAVGADLADEGGLGDVVVLAVDGDGAFGGVVAHPAGRGLHGG